MDNPLSYPQENGNLHGQAYRFRHILDGMRQTIAAGDDLPQAQHDQQQPTLVVRAGSPATLLRLIPHLLGFVPEASLIVIGVAPPRDRIRVTLRYDLPDPPAADLVAEIAEHALGVLSAQRLTAAVAVGYGPEALVAPVARELREAAWQAPIELREFLRVAGRPLLVLRMRQREVLPSRRSPVRRHRR